MDLRQDFKAREQGTVAGFGFATDESPPDAPRFRGLRFQITVLYLGIFAPLSTWETSDDPPLRRESMLGDICHCHGKKGDDVARIVEKHSGRWDLNCYDAVAGTGDGGGENEGSSGVHVFFERFNTGYVRKKVLASHLLEDLRHGHQGKRPRLPEPCCLFR